MRIAARVRLTSGVALAALLISQLCLPVLHRAARSTPDRDPLWTASELAGSEPGVDLHAGLPHDPGQCPICFALAQARSALGRAPLARALEAVEHAGAPVRAPRAILPRAPDLASAAPRAPPVLFLA
jgi:hypothetical protein